MRSPVTREGSCRRLGGTGGNPRAEYGWRLGWWTKSIPSAALSSSASSTALQVQQGEITIRTRCRSLGCDAATEYTLSPPKLHCSHATCRMRAYIGLNTLAYHMIQKRTRKPILSEHPEMSWALYISRRGSLQIRYFGCGLRAVIPLRLFITSLRLGRSRFNQAINTESLYKHQRQKKNHDRN